MRRRYPDCGLIEGEIRTLDDGSKRQNVSFYARSLEILTRYGLVTDEMLSGAAEDGIGGCRSGDLRDGGSFFLFSERTGTQGAYWYVRLYTDDQPRERKHFPVTEARQLLKQIAARSRG